VVTSILHWWFLVSKGEAKLLFSSKIPISDTITALLSPLVID